MIYDSLENSPAFLLSLFMMASTWISSSYPVNHPWFATHSMKRKPSNSNSTSSSSSRASSSSPPPTKRRRQTQLEAGFSTLSLATPTDVRSNPSAFPVVSEHVSSTPSDYDMSTIVLPSAIEEPSAPEIKMKSSTWYEPERDRIVVTDLDASSDEEDGTEPHTSSLSISRSLLKEISSRALSMTEPRIPRPVPSQALVLFTPLSIMGPPPNAEKKVVSKNMDIGDGVRDDDAMDVEPW